MAVLRCDFYSDAIAQSTSMSVILPQQPDTQIGTTRADSASGDSPGPDAGAAEVTRPDGPPVLYLLHGLSDDHSMWLRQTSIERYVDALGLAVVMPQVHRSFYTDEVYGGGYWTFLSEELPEIVHQFFRVSERRADTFVAGLSMGGYGAFKWALRAPHRFAAAANLSGAVDLEVLRARPDRPTDPQLFRRIFGDEPIPERDDLFSLVAQADPAELPALYLGCGTEDELVTQNRAFVQACRAADVSLTANFRPGAHTWSFWDAEIQRVLDWLPRTSATPAMT